MSEVVISELKGLDRFYVSRDCYGDTTESVCLDGDYVRWDDVERIINGYRKMLPFWTDAPPEVSGWYWMRCICPQYANHLEPTLIWVEVNQSSIVPSEVFIERGDYLVKEEGNEDKVHPSIDDLPRGVEWSSRPVVEPIELALYPTEKGEA